MRTIVHISDLHFGRTNPAILQPLLEFVRGVQPALVAVSGDLTQRARTVEYVAAREFLGAISFPKIVVPGNHDVPLRNPFNRFVKGLAGYKRYITPDLQPFYQDNEMAVAGVNTARALTWKDGRINRRQLRQLRLAFASVPGDRIKIVVTHHPFDLPEGTRGTVVGRSRLAMKTLAECGVDILLAGHFHIAAIGQTAKRYKLPGYSAIIVASGTSTSTRGRGQPNSLNLLRIENGWIKIERYIWHPENDQFEISSIEEFQKTNDGWIRG